MSNRYGDRDFERYDERREGDYGREAEYGREADYEEDRGGLFGRGTDHGSTWRSPRPSRDSEDYERGAEPRAYGRDYYTSRPGSYGAGYAGRDYDRAGRDEERYERPRARDYEQPQDRGGDERERHERHEHRARDTDYGRTTSRFFGRDRGETLPGQVPPDYGRDYEGDRGRDYERGRERGYGARYGGGPDYGDYERRGYEAYRPEREGRDRGRPRHREEEEEERGGRGRGWIDRAADGVLAWFGDEDAERRRRDESGQGYRGRGPKNYRRSDERIREDINDRLTEHEYLDASDIEVTVVAGDVILSGEVDNRHAKRLAEDIAESVTGVSNVQNNLRVQRERRAPAGADTAAGGTTTAATYTPGLAGLASSVDTTGATGMAGTMGTMGTAGTASPDSETDGLDTDGSARAAGSNT
jgi:osmotically-inducible protein OsmY